jgi:tRNA modification GTPase
VITIDGTHFRLIDTAGIRSTNDKIERAGIELAKDLLGGAFFKIKLISSNDFSFDQLVGNFDLFVITHADRMIDGIDSNREDFVIVDLVGPMGPEESGDKSGPIGPVVFGPMGPEMEKGINGPMGPDFLRNLIFKKIKDNYNKAFLNNPILIERQRNLIKELYDLLSENFDLLINESDFAIIDFFVNKISLLCEELIGIITPDELLTSIFNNFCIGK